VAAVGGKRRTTRITARWLVPGRVLAQQLDEVQRRDERIRDGAPGRQAQRRDERAVLLGDQRGTRERACVVELGQADEVVVVVGAGHAKQHTVEAGGNGRKGHEPTVAPKHPSRNAKMS
jgi:hypothetical protein